MDHPHGRAVRVTHLVRLVERTQHVDDEQQHDLDGHAAAHLAQVAVPLAEVKAVDVLEHHHVGAVLLAELEDRHDAGMAQIRENLCLAHEHADHALVALVLGQHQLDHDGAHEPAGPLHAGEVHHAHAAAGELPHHSVAAQDDATDEIDVMWTVHLELRPDRQTTRRAPPCIKSHGTRSYNYPRPARSPFVQARRFRLLAQPIDDGLASTSAPMYDG